MRKSKYQGVLKTNEHGYEYWLAQIYIDGKSKTQRCISEDHAANQYDKFRVEQNKEPINCKIRNGQLEPYKVYR